MNSDSELEVDALEDNSTPADVPEAINVEDIVELTNTKSCTPEENLTNIILTSGKFQRQLDRDSDEPNPKRRRTSIDLSVPNVNFKQFRGFSKVLKAISEFIVHIKEGSVYKTLGVTPPRGLLIHGPPGCGKTLLARTIAGQLKVPLISTSGPDLMPSMYGFFDNKIKNIFNLAQQNAPCIIFIDRIESATLKKDLANKLERKVTEQLLESIDELKEVEGASNIMVIGATTSIESMDNEFRMAGRFDKEVRLEMPDKDARLEILEYLTSSVKLHTEVSLEEVAECTPGYVAADLKALITEATVLAVTKVLRIKVKEKNGENEKDADYLPALKSGDSLLTMDEVDNLYINKDDFLQALKSVQPSTKREGFIMVPDVTWEDVGSLQEIRSQLKMSILFPVKHPHEFSLLGISHPTGILLCGPPGCGKTLLAKAVANEANINFISVKGPELLSMYVGESEKAVRNCFQRAKNAKPCIIFFDEIDSLCPKRSNACEGNNVIARVLNQLLTEMDGMEERKDVFILGATNRPDILDPAILRPGRFDKILFVGLPSPADRVDILKALTKNCSKPPMPNVDLDVIGKDPLLNGYTGADLAAVIKEASVEALIEFIDGKTSILQVTSEMILNAASRLRPSVSNQDMMFYKKLNIQYCNRTETSRSIGVP